ncbi:hypothetical protein JW998_10645 [candidate division KSB1 bacterium]|nr:hypothetical protein [candidate division KSB1 bacterium]
MNDPLYLKRLHKWYQKHFGIHVELRDGNTVKKKAFIDDTGPIAWRQTAFELPVAAAPTATLRVSFLPDNVMIDWIGVSYDSPPAYTLRHVACSEITDMRGRQKNIAPSLLEQDDDHYLITQPAESYHLTFDTGQEPPGKKRTCFLHSRGFYIEWLRREWYDDSMARTENITLQLDENLILRAAEQWLAKKEAFEKQFFDSKIQLAGEGKMQ